MAERQEGASLFLILLLALLLLGDLGEHVSLLLLHTVLALGASALVAADILEVAIVVGVHDIALESLDVSRSNTGVDETLEVGCVLVWVVLFHRLHVVTHMATEDALLVLLSVVLLGLAVVAKELLLGVWDL